MLKSVLFAAAAASVLLAPMAALSSGADPQAVPVFSGKYIFHGLEVCPDGTIQLSGTMDFNPDTGKVKSDEILVSGNPKHETPLSGTESYSNSANSVTFTSTVYHAYFGKLKKGKVESVAMIGVVDGGPADCGVQLNVSR